MERTTSHPTSRRPDVALKHIVCGVDGGRRDRTAIAQALRLAGGDGRVTFVAVAHVVGSGVAAQASVGLRRAEGALDAARRSARDSGVAADVDLLHAADAAEALLQRAEGATSARVVHRATLPVLITRAPEGGAAFPQQIVLATDGSADSGRAADLTAAIAAAHAAEVTMVHAGDASDAQRRRMRDQAARIADVTGSEPVWAVPTAHPVAAICSCAEWNRASLIVIGARGVTGIRALGSVSERVAHAAACSVLVARS
jgi:nucleotide-binding universal stress UspA family protein